MSWLKNDLLLVGMEAANNALFASEEVSPFLHDYYKPLLVDYFPVYHYSTRQ